MNRTDKETKERNYKKLFTLLAAILLALAVIPIIISLLPVTLGYAYTLITNTFSVCSKVIFYGGTLYGIGIIIDLVQKQGSK